MGYRKLMSMMGYGNEAVIYSLRLVNPDYTGPLIRVRRSPGNQEQDFYASAGELDTAALSAFITGTTSGFITTWYDQRQRSNGIYDLSMATASNQPRIVNAGVINTLNGKPTVEFDGTNDYLESSFNFLAGTNPAITVYSVVSKLTINNATNENMTVFGIGSESLNTYYAPQLQFVDPNPPPYKIGLRAKSPSLTFLASVDLLFTEGSLDLINTVDTGRSVSFYLNGSSAETVNYIGRGSVSNVGGLQMGHLQGATDKYWRGYISEVIIYLTAAVGNNKTSEIMTYYGI